MIRLIQMVILIVFLFNSQNGFTAEVSDRSRFPEFKPKERRCLRSDVQLTPQAQRCWPLPDIKRQPPPPPQKPTVKSQREKILGEEKKERKRKRVADSDSDSDDEKETKLERKEGKRASASIPETKVSREAKELETEFLSYINNRQAEFPSAGTVKGTGPEYFALRNCSPGSSDYLFQHWIPVPEIARMNEFSQIQRADAILRNMVRHGGKLISDYYPNPIKEFNIPAEALEKHSLREPYEELRFPGDLHGDLRNDNDKGWDILKEAYSYMTEDPEQKRRIEMYLGGHRHFDFNLVQKWVRKNLMIRATRLPPEAAAEGDHIIARKGGGSNDPRNLAICSKAVNGPKGDKYIPELVAHYGQTSGPVFKACQRRYAGKIATRRKVKRPRKSKAPPPPPATPIKTRIFDFPSPGAAPGSERKR